MKILLVILSLISVNAFATSEGLTSVWIVTENVQEEGDFGLTKTAVNGCYGVSQGPQLEQFAKPYEVKAAVGCGWDGGVLVDINALSCGEVTSSEESADYASFKKVTLDISKCSAEKKASKQFETMIRTAAARNFPQTKNGKAISSKEVELTIIK